MPRACILTYGCQMNLHDSEIVAGQLAVLGYDMTPDPAVADAVFVNTCTVRESAKSRGLSRLRSLSGLKRKNPKMFLAVMGCVASEEKEALRRSMPFLDAVIPTDRVTQIAKYLNAESADFGAFLNADTPKLRFSSFKAWVTIMTGCNMDCTYCIVPMTRGRERSRPLKDVLAEVERLAASGYREITFLGQTVNNYGEELGDPRATFLNLLIETDRRFPAGRVRFLSPHPAKITPELIDAWPRMTSLCEHLHLPVQSGSDRVLRRMKRFYRRDDVARKVDALRRAVPGIAITTDLIVGFPGETEEDFRETLSLCETVQFDDAYMYIYSPRADTAAVKLDGAVPYDVARERHTRLVEAQMAHTRRSLAGCVGRTAEVLIESAALRRARKTPEVFGKTRQFRDVILDASAGSIGAVVTARIDSVRGKTLRASAVAPVPAR